MVKLKVYQREAGVCTKIERVLLASPIVDCMRGSPTQSRSNFTKRSKLMLCSIHTVSDDDRGTWCIVSQAAFIAWSHQLGATPTIGQFGPSSDPWSDQTYNRLGNQECAASRPLLAYRKKQLLYDFNFFCIVFWSQENRLLSKVTLPHYIIYLLNFISLKSIAEIRRTFLCAKIRNHSDA